MVIVMCLVRLRDLLKMSRGSCRITKVDLIDGLKDIPQDFRFWRRFPVTPSNCSRIWSNYVLKSWMYPHVDVDSNLMWYIYYASCTCTYITDPPLAMRPPGRIWMQAVTGRRLRALSPLQPPHAVIAQSPCQSARLADMPLRVNVVMSVA